jgi:hypothetical protein
MTFFSLFISTLIERRYWLRKEFQFCTWACQFKYNTHKHKHKHIDIHIIVLTLKTHFHSYYYYLFLTWLIYSAFRWNPGIFHSHIWQWRTMSFNRSITSRSFQKNVISVLFDTAFKSNEISFLESETSYWISFFSTIRFKCNLNTQTPPVLNLQQMNPNDRCEDLVFDWALPQACVICEWKQDFIVHLAISLYWPELSEKIIVLIILPLEQRCWRMYQRKTECQLVSCWLLLRRNQWKQANPRHWNCRLR